MAPQRRKRRNAQRRKRNRRLRILAGSTIAILVVVVAVVVGVMQLSDPETKSSELAGNALVDERFSRLVATHPKKEISQDLYQLILSREVFYTFLDYSGGHDAAFGLIKREDIQMVDGSVIGGEGLVPFFAVGRLMMQESISDIAKQALMSHEYEHFLQWKDGTYPEHVLVLGGQVETAEEMEIVYANEVSAYTKQCAFVVEFDAVDEVWVCSTFERGDLLAFREQVARILLQNRNHQEYKSLLLELARR